MPRRPARPKQTQSARTAAPRRTRATAPEGQRRQASASAGPRGRPLPYARLEDAPPHIQRRAAERLEWVRVAQSVPAGSTLDRALDDYAAETGRQRPPRTTVLTWVTWSETHGILGLLDGPRADRGQLRSLKKITPKKRDALGDMGQLIETHVVGLRTGASTLQATIHRVARVQMPYSTLARWVAGFRRRNQAFVAYALDGAGGYADERRLSLGWAPVQPLEIWQLDSTPLDEEVLMPDRRTPDRFVTVRPHITRLVDVGTRALLTVEVVVGSLTPEAVLGVFRRVWVPGENWSGLPSVPALPKRLLLDAGSEHRGVVAEALASVGLKVPVRATDPEVRPHVERLHRTLNTQLSAGMVGRIGVTHGDPARAAASDSKRGRIARSALPYAGPRPALALRTLDELVEAVRQQAIDYNARPHRGLARDRRALAERAPSTAP